MGTKNNSGANAEDQSSTTETQTDESTQKTEEQLEFDGANTESEKQSKTGDVSLETLKAELAKARREAQATQKKLADIERAKLEATGDWKKLWETERKRAEELESKLEKSTHAFVTTQKQIAVKEAMLKAGIRQDALKIIERDDFDAVEVEVVDGQFKASGVELAVQKYRSEYPFLFSKDPGKVNSGGSGGSSGGASGPVTPTDVYAAERKYGVRSQEYQDVMKRYLEQKRNANQTTR